MIIRTNKLSEGTHLKEEDGKLTLTRVTDIDPILQSNFESKKDLNNGFSKDRSYRKIASVSMDTWLGWCKQNPELVVGDKELREKTLKKLLYTDEGKMFWSVEKGI